MDAAPAAVCHDGRMVSDDESQDESNRDGETGQEDGWRSRVSVAVVSSAVIAAVVSGGAGYLGAARGADSSLQASRESVRSQESEKAKDRADKERDERRSAGLAFLAAAGKASSLLAGAMASITQGEPPNTELWAKVQENDRELNESFTKVRAYSGPSATNLAHRLLAYYSDVAFRIDRAMTDAVGAAEGAYADNPVGWARLTLISQAQNLQIQRWDYVGDCRVDEVQQCLDSQRPVNELGMPIVSDDDSHKHLKVRTQLQAALFD